MKWKQDGIFGNYQWKVEWKYKTILQNQTYPYIYSLVFSFSSPLFVYLWEGECTFTYGSSIHVNDMHHYWNVSATLGHRCWKQVYNPLYLCMWLQFKSELTSSFFLFDIKASKIVIPLIPLLLCLSICKISLACLNFIAA